MNLLWKRLYILPALVLIPMKGFSGACNGYHEYKNLSLSGHIIGCCIHTYMGLIEGAFIGMLWPISLPVYIKRQFDEKNA